MKLKKTLVAAVLCGIVSLSFASVADDNLKAGKAYLESNKSKPQVVTLGSGLQYKILKTGKGESPGANDTVVVDYEGTTIDGKVFDSSFRRGQPATFRVDQVIKGWQYALQLMKPGSEWMLYIPANLAYGSYNVPNIGPNQVLIFKVVLHSVQESYWP